jgi:hypothetical protein
MLCLIFNKSIVLNGKLWFYIIKNVNLFCRVFWFHCKHFFFLLIIRRLSSNMCRYCSTRALRSNIFSKCVVDNELIISTIYHHSTRSCKGNISSKLAVSYGEVSRAKRTLKVESPSCSLSNNVTSKLGVFK